MTEEDEGLRQTPLPPNPIIDDMGSPPSEEDVELDDMDTPSMAWLKTFLHQLEHHQGEKWEFAGLRDVFLWIDEQVAIPAVICGELIEPEVCGISLLFSRC